MIYFIFGPNTYLALNKINEFKSEFKKKNGEDSFVESFSDSELGEENINNIFFRRSLFSKTRLVIFKNVLGDGGGAVPDFLKTYKDEIKVSKDVFLFYEENIKKTDKSFLFLKNNAQKTQEMPERSSAELSKWLEQKSQILGLKLGLEERSAMIAEAGSGGEWALENELEKISLGERHSDFDARRSPLGLSAKNANGANPSPFGFVERIFSEPLGRALITLKKAAVNGHSPERFIYPLLWKVKQKKMTDAYWRGILAESQMRRDPKNSYEILERFIVSIKA